MNQRLANLTIGYIWSVQKFDTNSYDIDTVIENSFLSQYYNPNSYVKMEAQIGVAEPNEDIFNPFAKSKTLEYITVVAFQESTRLIPSNIHTMTLTLSSAQTMSTRTDYTLM